MYERDRAWLLRDKYGGMECSDFFADCKKLQRGEHVAYVIGWVPFLGCHISLSSRPLIPRQETEWWSECVIRDIKNREGSQIQCLDLFAGSGCIGVAILKHDPRTIVTFGEIDIQHLKTIEKNILLNSVDISHARIIETDIFSYIEDTFDLIVANPPYINKTRQADLEKSLWMEPAEALFAKERGLYYIRRLLEEVRSHLVPGGKLYMEYNSGEEGEIESIAKNAGLSATFHKDQYGLSRFLVAQ